MCGRTACTLSAARMQHIAGISKSLPRAAASASAAAHDAPQAPQTAVFRKFNISPSGVLPIVIERGAEKKERTLLLAEWGLRPPTHCRPASATDTTAAKPAAFPYSSFNARVEGLTTSKLYKRLLNSRRCVLVVDGFYEWKKDVSDPKKKQPYFIRMRPTLRESRIPLGSGGEQQQKSSVETVAAATGQQQPVTGSASSRKRRRSNAEGSDSSAEAGKEEEAATDNSSSKAAAAAGDRQTAAAARADEERHLEEREKQEGTLQPGEAPLLLAGLYDYLYSPAEDRAAETADSSSKEEEAEGEKAASVSCSVTILTMSSGDTPLEALHSRIPVALSPAVAAEWLDCGSTSFDACIRKVTEGSKALYRDSISYYAVTPRVGNSRYEGPDCTQPLVDEAAGAADDKKQQSLLFSLQPREREVKRTKHEKSATQQQVLKGKQQQVTKREEQQQRLGEEQQQQVKEEKLPSSHLPHQQHVDTRGHEEEQQGIKEESMRKVKHTAASSSGRTTGMKSMHHYFKRAAPKKQDH